VTQERAIRTRARVVQAASVEFDQLGYEGTSLARINKAAGTTLGALTFHFPTKQALADAVEQRSSASTRQVVAAVLSTPRPALASVVELTLALARLLREDVCVRAAARLARERPASQTPWPAEWLPVLEELFRRAQDERGMRPGSDPRAALALAAQLVMGTEAQLHNPGALSRAMGENPVAQLTQIWNLVLCGLAVKRAGDQAPTLGAQ